MKMMDLGIIAISGVCTIVLVIGIMGRKAEIIVNFVLILIIPTFAPELSVPTGHLACCFLP